MNWSKKKWLFQQPVKFEILSFLFLLNYLWPDFDVALGKGSN